MKTILIRNIIICLIAKKKKKRKRWNTRNKYIIKLQSHAYSTRTIHKDKWKFIYLEQVRKK